MIFINIYHIFKQLLKEIQFGYHSKYSNFKGTDFQKLPENSTLNLPERQTQPGIDKKLPHIFVADYAFPPCPNIMKPYSGHQ